MGPSSCSSAWAWVSRPGAAAGAAGAGGVSLASGVKRCSPASSSSCSPASLVNCLAFTTSWAARPSRWRRVMLCRPSRPRPAAFPRPSTPRPSAISPIALGISDLAVAVTMSSCSCTANGASGPNALARLPVCGSRLSVSAVETIDSTAVPAPHRRACCMAGLRARKAPAVKAAAGTKAWPATPPMALVVRSEPSC